MTTNDRTGATPGPWIATERCGYHEILAPDDGCEWYGRPNMHAVAYCDTEIDEGEQEANARLIAAAPALLSQLQYAVKLLGAFPALGGTAQVQSMRAAIAQATGGHHDL